MHCLGGTLKKTMSYKDEQEQFVSGHSGGSVLELLSVVAVLPSLALLQRAITAHLAADNAPTWLRALIELALFAVGIVTAFTFAHLSVPISLASLLISFLLLSSSRKKGKIVTDTHAALDGKAKPFLSSYRALMMLATCVAILAVDFVVFPRRFAKCEMFGISLMDMGVGSFVFSSGVVSPVARGLGARRVSAALLSSAPLFALGVVRLLMVKGIDYQEHVSEYGVHWNFFFTLAAVAVAVSLVRVPARLCGAVGLAIGALHQLAISAFDIDVYVEQHPRTNLLHQNKEGIVSAAGYVAAYLIGVHVGHHLLCAAQPAKSATGSGGARQRWRRTLVTLSAVAALFWALGLAAHYCVQPCSRRMANLPYVLLVAAYNLTMIMALLAVDLVAPPQTSPSSSSLVIDAINKNQLVIFLIANVSVGAVNASMQTIHQPPLIGYAVVIAYTSFVALVALLLSSYSLKFW
jgi:glucosaminylphosphatidylinositol acyltransferase